MYLGIVVTGAVLVIDNIPSLKANVLEIVNPRVQEGELVRTLQQTLEELDSAVPGSGAASATTIQKSKQLISESKDLLRQISDINEEHAGVTTGIITKAVDALIGTVVSATPSLVPVPATTPTVLVSAMPCANQ